MSVNTETTIDTKGDALTITRVFDAPRERVWKAWSDPNLLQQWWGPEHFTVPAYTADFREGGQYHYCMRSPEGQDYWGVGVYQEIVPMERIVYTDAFADEKGNSVTAAHYGMDGDWADELIVTLTFEDHDGRTRFTLRHTGLPQGQHREMCGIGWSESFDKLETLVKSS
ncbi:MAG: SRPBCC domain-containing protein [Candidatus Hydrogenedentes bacterium]|nr:SRPBCC domain-containing protein [Candidatus Hydrogenedentota bacterium]